MTEKASKPSLRQMASKAWASTKRAVKRGFDSGMPGKSKKEYSNELKERSEKDY